MAEQAWSDAAKTIAEWIAGLGLFSGAIKAYRKASNENYLSRITKLEYQNMELRRVINNSVEEIQGLASTMDIDRGDNHRRFQRIESDLRETKRITRDKLLEIADTLGEQLNRSQQPEPPRER